MNTRIEIDLNSVDENGLTAARVVDANGPLVAGHMVTAFESEEGVRAVALVDHIDGEYAFLRVNWASMTDDTPVPFVQYEPQGIRNTAGVRVARQRGRNSVLTDLFTGALPIAPSAANAATPVLVGP